MVMAEIGAFDQETGAFDRLVIRAANHRNFRTGFCQQRTVKCADRPGADDQHFASRGLHAKSVSKKEWSIYAWQTTMHDRDDRANATAPPCRGRRAATKNAPPAAKFPGPCAGLYTSARQAAHHHPVSGGVNRAPN